MLSIYLKQVIKPGGIFSPDTLFVFVLIQLTPFPFGSPPSVSQEPGSPCKLILTPE
jgi:hypothetical protein